LGRRQYAGGIFVIPRGKEAAALALHRFGFGPSITALNFSIAAVASDPRGAILTELDRPRAGMVSTNLLSSAQASARYPIIERRSRRRRRSQGVRKKTRNLKRATPTPRR
jgi:hypothetical protein